MAVLDFPHLELDERGILVIAATRFKSSLNVAGEVSHTISFYLQRDASNAPVLTLRD